MDDFFAAIQPSNDNGGAAPPTPPAAPVLPEPSAPVAPVVPDAGAQDQLSAADQADVDEWAQATEDMFPGLSGANKKENVDEQADASKKPEETGADKGTDEAAKPGAAADKPAGDDEAADAAGADDAAGEGESAGPPELSAGDRQQLEVSVKAEIAQKMFTEAVNGKSVVTTPDGSKYFLDGNGRPMLADSDGDPIRGIDDIMKLVNPRTGQAFTEEQAGMWLLNANQRMRDNLTDMSNQINEIASTGLTMKEESETIAWQYGELLKAMPDLQKDLWSDYEKTLVKDPKTGIVTRAPISLQKFYERALEPYARLAAKLETDATPTPPAASPPAATPPAPESSRQQRRADRSDIYGGGKVDEATEGDKEWDAAAQAVFGDQLKNLGR